MNLDQYLIYIDSSGSWALGNQRLKPRETLIALLDTEWVKGVLEVGKNNEPFLLDTEGRIWPLVKGTLAKRDR